MNDQDERRLEYYQKKIEDYQAQVGRSQDLVNHCQAIIDYYQGKVAKVVDDKTIPGCPVIPDSSDPASVEVLECEQCVVVEPIVTLRSPGYLSPGDTTKLLKLCAIGDVPLYTHPASRRALECEPVAVVELSDYISFGPSKRRRAVQELFDGALVIGDKLYTHPARPEVPEFLLEMSRQMREQPSRSTSHPFWQVRCKRYLPTDQGCSESHYEVCGAEGPVYSSKNPVSELSEYLLENYESWCREWASENHEDDADYTDAVSSWIDPESELPEDLTLVYMQEIEVVVTTHLTQAGAEAFIKRKQHDYPELYTYVESAYWSPQLRELQDWIIGLTPKQEKGQ